MRTVFCIVAAILDDVSGHWSAIALQKRWKQVEEYGFCIGLKFAKTM